MRRKIAYKKYLILSGVVGLLGFVLFLAFYDAGVSSQPKVIEISNADLFKK